MKKVKITFLLLISILLLTGCNTSTYEYDGDEIFFELNGTDTDTINAEGAKVVVKKDQAFIEINDDTSDYNTYTKGEHDIEKKETFYNYYFINLDEVKDNKFGTNKPIKLTDKTYGELELNVYGIYDYKISNIKDFTSSFVKVDPNEFLDIRDFVRKIVVDTIGEEIVKLDVKYSDLPSYSESIKKAVIDSLQEKGITCNSMTIQSMDLTDESMGKAAAIDTNNIMLKMFVQNTTWIASDNSEIIFDKDRFNWYLNQNDHTDNVQYGDYVFYVGDLAVEYITKDLKSFGVTNDELVKLFNSNEKYDKSNFVVFNIKLEGYTINGKTTTVNQDIYWYGFLLNDNKNLQVVNMTTATYYNFIKK